MRKPCTGGLALALITLAVAPGPALATHSPNHRTVVGSFGHAPVAPITGEIVTFTSTAAALGSNNRLVSQGWDLDNDGAFDDASGATASRAFSPAGAYTVRLRVVDKDSNEAVAAQAVMVRDPPPTPLLSPFPVVQLAGRVTGRGTRVRLSVRAPIGATVSVRCRGRGCSLRKQTRQARTRSPSAGSPTALIRFRRFERRVLSARVVLKVFVTRPGTIGKYAHFKMRRRKPPKRTDRCVTPGTTVPIPCPTS